MAKIRRFIRTYLHEWDLAIQDGGFAPPPRIWEIRHYLACCDGDFDKARQIINKVKVRHGRS